MSENLFEKVWESLSSEKHVGGGVMIYPERFSLGIIVTGFYLLPFVLFYGISGGVFFTTKKAFDAIGGFDEDWLSAEDIDFARRLKYYAKTQGKSFKNLYTAYITTSCRKFDRFGDWYFCLRPWLVLKLLFNKSRKDADKIWYDFNSSE